MRDDACRFAGHDILGLEVALVRYDIDCRNLQHGAGRRHGLGQQPHVENLAAHLLLDDQLVLYVNRELDIVAHADPGVPCHGPAVGIGQGYLVVT